MILLTLGTIPFPFHRAINWLKSLLDKGVIFEPVFIQHGASDISRVINHPLVSSAPILPSAQLMAKVKEARLIISHAGQGLTCKLAASQAQFVLLPRLASFNEHIDNHQLIFAQSVARMGVHYCLSLRELEKFILSPPPKFHTKLFVGPRLADHLTKVYPN